MKSFKALFVLFVAVIFFASGPFISAASADYDEKAYELRELCASGTPEEIQAAIDGGADVNVPGTENMTALMIAAGLNKNPEAVSVLLKAGADIDAKAEGYSESTALMDAVRYNDNPEVAGTLVKAGADVDAVDGWGMTALLYAVKENKKPEVISILIDGGADVNAKDGYGWTAMTHAVKNNNSEIVSLLEKAGAAETPAKAQGAVKAKESFDKFIELCKTGTPEQIQAAIDGGADVKAKNADGDTALMMAAGYNENPKAVSVLLKAGADVNAQFAEYTPLMYAAGYNKNPKVVSVLIEAGADVNAMGYEGSTVLSVAESNENEEVVPEIVSILKKAGAK